jgi:hypothetical protein
LVPPDGILGIAGQIRAPKQADLLDGNSILPMTTKPDAVRRAGRLRYDGNLMLD